MLKNMIVYEDKSILILDKPQGLAVTPGEHENICELIFNKYPDLALVKGYKTGEGGLLNRLDNETGGLVLIAKYTAAFNYYAGLMKAGLIEKTYLAIVDGIPEQTSGIIEIPIAHHYKNKKKMTICNDRNKYRGKPQKAFTEWKLIKSAEKTSLLKIKIKKGARHQIRLHLAYSGFPIIGDKLYNKNSTNQLITYHQLYAVGVDFLSYEKKQIHLWIKAPFEL